MLWPKKTPLRWQVNPVECGAVCLGIIFEYYGEYFSASYLNKIAKVSRNGSTASDLVNAAKQCGWRAFGRMKSVSELKFIKTPSIIFVDHCHFVVFEGLVRGRYYLNDPARGRYSLSALEFRRRYSRVIIEFESSKQARLITKFPRSKDFYEVTGCLLLALQLSALVLMLNRLILGFAPVWSYWLLIGLFLLLVVSLLSWLFLKVNRRLKDEYHGSQALISSLGKLSPGFFENRPWGRFIAVLDHRLAGAQAFLTAWEKFPELQAMGQSSQLMKADLGHEPKTGPDVSAFMREISEQPSSMWVVDKNLPDKLLLSMKDLSFAYAGEPHVINSLNWQIEHSKIYILSGPSGCGKSTLMRILGQKLSPSSGQITSRDKDFRVALIDDDADLFAGSLIENVSLFCPNISSHHVVKALQQASIEDLFYNRPMGLLTHIERHGANISGGQKKRLLLARALVHKPHLIMLDNFFDTLDEPCARKIIAQLHDLAISVIFSAYRDESSQEIRLLAYD